MRRIRGAVPTFSVYFQLIVLAVKVLTVLEIQDYGRHLASSLGLTPRERSSGALRRLGRITNRGDAYLRRLLIHGARALVCHATQTASPDRLRA